MGRERERGNRGRSWGKAGEGVGGGDRVGKGVVRGKAGLWGGYKNKGDEDKRQGKGKTRLGRERVRSGKSILIVETRHRKGNRERKRKYEA